MRIDRSSTLGERLVLLVSHLAGVAEAILFLISASFISAEFRGTVLFSDWAESMIRNDRDIRDGTQ